MLAKINNFLNGIIRESAVSDDLMPEGAVREAINVNFDVRGSIQGRPGMTAINGQIVAGKPCLGIHDCLFSTTAYNKFLVVMSDGTNNDIYYKNGVNWTKTLEDDTKDLKTRFITFLDRVIRVNGTEIAKAWDGNAATWSQWAGTGAGDLNLDDMDSYKCNLIESFKLRVYMAGDSNKPDRLYFSTIVSNDRYITWDPTTDWIDINPNDGDNITAIKRFALDLLIFKKNFLYRYRGIANVDPEPLIPIGTYSNESVVSTKAGVFFFHNTGVYLYTGSYPQEISLPINDIIQAVSYANYSNVVGWADNDNVYFSIGDITVEGKLIANAVIRYTISSQVWTVYSMGSEIKWAGSYNTGSAITQVVGDDNGYILTFNNGTTDNTAPIYYSMITKWYSIESISNTFVMRKFSSVCDKAQGSKLQCQVDTKENRWETLGELKKFFNIHNKEVTGHRVRFKLSGSSKVEPFIFRGIDILEGMDLGVIE